jgi:thiol-disulfide isomerase/thioredoxin
MYQNSIMLARVLSACALVAKVHAECVDHPAEPGCVAWANAGECPKNPKFMLSTCCASCQRVLQRGPPPQREAWETEDLESAWPGSAVTDVTPTELLHLANMKEGRALIVWFYAPWCKQCKLSRPGFEATAKALSSRELGFARLDCTRWPAAKDAYSVYSYPAFKVFRGHRNRWIEAGRNRTEEVLTPLFSGEARGPYSWAESEEELREWIYGQVDASASQDMRQMGRGEAVALALLSSREGEHADLLGRLASGCSVRLSPMPFVATTDASLFEKMGLEAPPLDHLAIVKLFSEPEGAPASEQLTPRMVSAPLASFGGPSLEGEKAACDWALGHRLPLLIDFESDMAWGKRAGQMAFIKVHALLFLSPPHAHLAAVVRSAASRFVKGAIVVMQFMVKGMDVGDNAMFPRYGVNSALDTPRLVFLDQRLAKSENRQRVFPGEISEEAVYDFLVGLGIPTGGVHSGGDPEGGGGALTDGEAAKDEL